MVHSVTGLVSWRQLFDRYGLAKVGNHLWISTWHMRAIGELFLIRHSDGYTFDARRQCLSLKRSIPNRGDWFSTLTAQISNGRSMSNIKRWGEGLGGL